MESTSFAHASPGSSLETYNSPEVSKVPPHEAVMSRQQDEFPQHKPENLIRGSLQYFLILIIKAEVDDFALERL